MRIEVDTAHPLGAGVAADTYGFYNNSPFFALTEGFASQKVSVVARYPNANIVASGWLRGEEFMAGRAAVVAVDMKPGPHRACSACARSTARRRRRRSRCCSTASTLRRVSRQTQKPEGRTDVRQKQEARRANWR